MCFFLLFLGVIPSCPASLERTDRNQQQASANVDGLTACGCPALAWRMAASSSEGKASRSSKCSGRSTCRKTGEGSVLVGVCQPPPRFLSLLFFPGAFWVFRRISLSVFSPGPSWFSYFLGELLASSFWGWQQAWRISLYWGPPKSEGVARA